MGLFIEGVYVVLGGICTKSQAYRFTTRRMYVHFTMDKHYNNGLKKTAAATDVCTSQSLPVYSIEVSLRGFLGILEGRGSIPSTL